MRAVVAIASVAAVVQAGEIRAEIPHPPAWLPMAGLGFLEGFTKAQDLDGCIMGALGPVSDITDGISDIKKGIKGRNVTDIEEGVASLRKVMEDLPPAMQGCKMEEEDVQAIMKVLKGFHSLKDIIGHVKADLKADESAEIAREFELMVRSFEEKQYQDFGKHAGQLLHRLFIGTPKGSTKVKILAEIPHPPAWLPMAGLGFLEGFTKAQDLDGCVMGALGPVSDITDGISDIKKGIKGRNVTDIEEGVASLRKVMEDLPTAMQGCKMEEEDVQAIMKVLKGFHSLKDIIGHIKADLKADESAEIAREFELMVRSFEEKQYQDFGKHAGQLLHRLFIGKPQSEILV